MNIKKKNNKKHSKSITNNSSLKNLLQLNKNIEVDDLCKILFEKYKDKYKCTSIKKKEWYEFNNSWQKIDNGETVIRTLITSYLLKEIVKFGETLRKEDYETEDEYKLYLKKIKFISLNLRDSKFRDEIQERCKETFYNDKNSPSQNEFKLNFFEKYPIKKNIYSNKVLNSKEVDILNDRLFKKYSQELIDKAIKNYGNFYKLSSDSVDIEKVYRSKAGIEGWADCNISLDSENREIKNNEINENSDNEYYIVNKNEID